jgi:acetylornithine deacetylase
VNVLAGEARVVWENAPLPDRDEKAVFERAQGATWRDILPRYRTGAPEADFSPCSRGVSGLVRDVDSPAVRLACALSGSNDVHTVVLSAPRPAVPAGGIPAVVCGPGSIHVAHKADEFVELDQLEAVRRFLRRVAQRAAQ